jgi:hypothetical protein
MTIGSDRVLTTAEWNLRSQGFNQTNEIDRVDRVIVTEWDAPAGVSIVKKVVQVSDPGKYEFKLIVPEQQTPKTWKFRLARFLTKILVR